MENYYY